MVKISNTKIEIVLKRKVIELAITIAGLCLVHLVGGGAAFNSVSRMLFDDSNMGLLSAQQATVVLFSCLFLLVVLGCRFVRYAESIYDLRIVSRESRSNRDISSVVALRIAGVCLVVKPIITAFVLFAGEENLFLLWLLVAAMSPLYIFRGVSPGEQTSRYCLIFTPVLGILVFALMTFEISVYYIILIGTAVIGVDYYLCLAKSSEILNL